MKQDNAKYEVPYGRKIDLNISPIGIINLGYFKENPTTLVDSRYFTLKAGPFYTREGLTFDSDKKVETKTVKVPGPFGEEYDIIINGDLDQLVIQHSEVGKSQTQPKQN